jgi:hypothetical protein
MMAGQRESHVAGKDKHPLASCFAYGSVICSSTFARGQVESDASAKLHSNANRRAMSWHMQLLCLAVYTTAYEPWSGLSVRSKRLATLAWLSKVCCRPEQEMEMKPWLSHCAHDRRCATRLDIGKTVADLHPTFSITTTTTITLRKYCGLEFVGKRHCTCRSP